MLKCWNGLLQIWSHMGLLEMQELDYYGSGDASVLRHEQARCFVGKSYYFERGC